MEYTVRMIGGKAVYIVEEHHQVLIPWGIERRKAAQSPALITFDYHTDTRPAFLHYAFSASGQDERKAAIMRREMSSAAAYDDLAAAVKKLSNDEHIDYAMQAGIIKAAFAFSFEGNTTWSVQEKQYWEDESPQGAMRRMKAPPPLPPYTYEEPESMIFVIHTGGSGIKSANRILESEFLTDKFAAAAPMAACAGINELPEYPYILDIDLDYFTTKKSICPDDASFFHMLIKKAQFVSIAKEPDFVMRHRIENDLDSDYLLKQLMQHIEQAMS
ncbi:MAG: UPF0489 family protein [Victivallaceae bacterium]|jgi:hypothetical protein